MHAVTIAKQRVKSKISDFLSDDKERLTFCIERIKRTLLVAGSVPKRRFCCVCKSLIAANATELVGSGRAAEEEKEDYFARLPV